MAQTPLFSSPSAVSPLLFFYQKLWGPETPRQTSVFSGAKGAPPRPLRSRRCGGSGRALSASPRSLLSLPPLSASPHNPSPPTPPSSHCIVRFFFFQLSSSYASHPSSPTFLPPFISLYIHPPFPPFLPPHLPRPRLSPSSPFSFPLFFSSPILPLLSLFCFF